MNSEPMLPFGPPPTERVDQARVRQWGDARREAHKRQSPSRKEAMWNRIVAYVREHGDATADEITAAWGASPNSVAPRVCELLKLGRLVKTGAYRKTRYGCDACVVKEREQTT
jgi:hypothetical protein